MNNSKVKVAVRVRPLNQREEGLNSECVVQVSGNQITLLPPISCKEKARKEPHTFIYDNCFWTEGRHETGQEDVFEHLKDGVLENIWLGYNVCIFAYGQTGSGKTFSMMGTDDQPGIVPRICSALFNKESNDLETIRIEASYFEIYNEEVRDLLRSEEKQGKLRVREDRLLGPYVEELSCHAVQSYGEIKLLLDQGNKQRAIAETKMNEQSSRSHSILSLTVTQTCNGGESGASRELVSKVSLVDLAGSERSYKSGAKGSQLKECCNINKSLLTLGLVINSLAEISENKRKSQYVKYRDSVLTWLLKNNLGGNSKTIMLATVSPAADNYQETLSTLRYADSAKRIVNQAVVNEDVKSKAIEELQEEIKRLREQLTTTEHVKTEVHKLKSQLEEKENLLRDLKTSWEEKLKRTEVASQEWKKNLEHMGVILKKQNVIFNNDCYLIQQSTKLIIHNINDITNIGSGPSQDIQISGPEAECEHCVIRKTEEGEVFLTPVDNSKTHVNGCLSKTKTQLWHEDKIQIGTNVFVLHQPSRPKPEHMRTKVSSEAEVQTYDGLNTENGRSPILSERDGWNSNMIENEKSAFYKAAESSAPTIPASDDDLNSTDMFTQMSNGSSQPIDIKVNTTGLEYLEIGEGSKVQDFMVPCSLQYGEASSQTSEILRNSNCLQKTIDLEDHSTLPSDTKIRKECRERLAVFTWNPKTDVTPLLKLLSELSVFEYWTVCGCIPHLAEDKWKSYVDRPSTIFLYHSYSPETPQLDLFCLKKFLDYSREKHGPENIKVVIADVEDINSERKITEWWMVGDYRDWELLTLSKAEIRFLIKHKINPLSPERRMANKLRHFYQILHEAEEKRRQQNRQKSAESWEHWFIEKGIVRVVYKQVIFSRSTQSEYSWITDLLHSDHFRDHVSGVKHYNFSQPINTVCGSFGILYFTKKKEQQNNEMDAADVQLIQQYRRRFGKDNVIVVMDDVEDSSDQEKIRILRSHPDIEDLYHNLFLFSQQEKSSEYRTLLSYLLTIKEPPQHQANEARTLNEVLRPNQQTSPSFMNKTAKYEPQMPACQNFGAEIPEFQYSMNYKKLGMCIIINNKKFDDSKMFPVRDGTDKDAEDLSKCFGDLGFEATVYNNLSCEVMKQLLECVAKSDHSDSACFACILLSHGKEGAICGTDGAIPINTLTKHFRGDQCKSLRGKPKLFFIQACRGPKKDEGVVADSEPADSSLEEDANPGSRIPVEADFLFVYATVPGYVSWRDTERGTWFIQVLCEVFNQYWYQLEILQMLTRVNNQVANKPGQKKQMPSVDSRLTKGLYFKMFYTVNPSGSNNIRKQGGKPISF